MDKSITRLQSYVAATVRCSVKMRESEDYLQYDFGDAYGRIVNTGTGMVIENITDFRDRWSLSKIKI